MERRAIMVHGIVQGVGFRPFVFALASRHHLHGFVRNQTSGVLIEVEGEAVALDRFLSELSDQTPPLARITDVSWESCPPRGDQTFHIAPSQADPSAQVFISPDAAVCDKCLAELFDPADRRFGYPFLNCTNCGPRLTIIRSAPYDRPRTTMATFVMCDACRAEYKDPSNRRFHAQPNACPLCGPSLQLLDATGQRIQTIDPLRSFAEALRGGTIGALKGLGGYLLACSARDSSIVAELRRRKHRDEKPFAIMVADLAAAEALGKVGPVERELLQSPSCPIVLLRKRSGAAIAEEVAPRNPWLGVILPYTPLHHLLLRAVHGAPLVMTSGNRSDEPIAYRDDEALASLAGIADVLLTHNRPIQVRCDDSVTRVVDGLELPVRRSRGYAPQPIDLPFDCPSPILAVGGQFKATFALGRGPHVFLSHHMGDLDHFEAFQAFTRDVELYQQLFAVAPTLLVHDLHPDYASTRYARERAAREGSALLTVQHHHAHLAACLADNGLDEPVLGITFDGTGIGTDGAVWGGEFLLGDYRSYRRAAHFRYVGMPGGEQAIRQPWRMALAHLVDAGTESPSLSARLSPLEIRTVTRMLERRLNTPLTSSVGRLFDVVAALAGVRDRVNYEGQAAVEMEGLATGVAPDGAYPFDLLEVPDGPTVVDTRPLIRAVARETNATRIARRFHSTLVEIIAAVCGRIRKAIGVDAVALSGGVFLNVLLTEEVSARLKDDGFRVYRHRLVPPNDGGLSLGQLAIAARISGPRSSH
jgi:hydrogenase maturation protein HypF